MIVPPEKDRLESTSLLDRSLLSDLDGDKPQWSEEEMKLYRQGLEDNTTVVTFSIEVFYSVDVGEQTGGKITQMVDAMIEKGNKRLERLGALAKAELHCLEQMDWTDEGFLSATGQSYGAITYYKNEVRNSADASVYIFASRPGGICGWGILGSGLARSYRTFAGRLMQWDFLPCVDSDNVFVHELGHNLGLSHAEMNQDDDEAYYGRVFKELRFALAAVGDESATCAKQEADWEFRSRCFKSFGHYTGGELETEGRTIDDKTAKECQARCAATDGCSFFAFKDVGARCHLSSSAGRPTRAKGVVSGPVPCDAGKSEGSSTCYDEKLDPKGEEYKGFANTTESGRACQAWAAKSPQKPYGPIAKKLSGESNYCRNPDGEPGPWCYTTDPDKRWELCSPELRCGAQGCLKENVKYKPNDDFLGATQHWIESSSEACQARCAAHSKCAFFSFWEADLPKDNGCTLYGDDAVFVEQEEITSGSEKMKMYQHVTGPASCPGEPSEQFRGSHEGGLYCTADLPCGLGEGDCNKDKECQGDLLCGMNNCKNSFFNAEDDCCEEPPSYCVDTTTCFGKVSDPKGEHYDGCVNTTVSGRTCQAWASTSPHSHRFTSNTRLVGNYCRNPDGEPGPWCYTTDPYKRWELCSVSTCDQGGQP